MWRREGSMKDFWTWMWTLFRLVHVESCYYLMALGQFMWNQLEVSVLFFGAKSEVEKEASLTSKGLKSGPQWINIYNNIKLSSLGASYIHFNPHLLSLPAQPRFLWISALKHREKQWHPFKNCLSNGHQSNKRLTVSKIKCFRENWLNFLHKTLLNTHIPSPGTSFP